MKSKIKLISLVALAALTLTACDFIFPNISNSGGYSYLPIWDGEAQKADATISDYIANSIYGYSSAPSEGEAKLLVIPVWFDDSDKYIDLAKRETVRQDISKAFFGTIEDTGWQSVKSYYETESHGVLTLTGTVSEWYGLDKNIALANYSVSVPNTTQLVKEATDWYFSNHSESRASYDKDKDGHLDGVILIYGVPDYSALGYTHSNNSTVSNLWAYCNWTRLDKNTLLPTVNVFLWASYVFMYGSNVASERTGQFGYYSGDTRYCNIDAHTYIHEMGHIFGLTDYYDYSQSYSPAGGFSMQDRNIGGHDPFSVFALGWAQAYVPNQSATINLKPFSTTGEIIILSPEFNDINSPFDEYLIIEYYTRDGLNELDSRYNYLNNLAYPTGPDKKGIRLWHVDARLLYSKTGRFTASNVTTDPSTDKGRVAFMMSNTYAPGPEGYISPLGDDYGDYNLIQLIRNEVTATHKMKSAFSNNSLFTAETGRNEFTMHKFDKQFVRRGKLNNGKQLGFTFKVNSLDVEHASISITKL
ncbi:MAG: hypothetical protein GXY27_03205 [Erysipelotrichaceae bacterium]|nr:hypothetical protein [Erysipelotrichaceae bacterium]